MPTRPRTAILSVLVFLLAACGSSANTAPGTLASGSPSASAKPIPTPGPTATPKPEVAPPPADIPTDGTCEAQHTCFGLLKADVTYHTAAFKPTITFRVPASGWENLADQGGVFQLLPLGHPGDLIAFFRDPVAVGTDGKVVRGVGQSPTALATWMANNDQLDVTPARSVTLGGLKGVVLDVKVAASATSPGPADCPTRVCVPLFSGKDPSARPTWVWDWGVAGREAARLYLVTSDAGVIAVFVDSLDGTTLQAMNDQANQIFTSLKFG